MGNEQMVSLLIQRGALVNIPGYCNNTPLHDAAETGNTTIARLLLQHGANPCVRYMVCVPIVYRVCVYNILF